MSDQGGLHGTVPLGAPLPGGAVGEVIASASAELPAGSLVLSMAHGWRDHYLAPASQLQALSSEAGPIAAVPWALWPHWHCPGAVSTAC